MATPAGAEADDDDDNFPVDSLCQSVYLAHLDRLVHVDVGTGTNRDDRHGFDDVCTTFNDTRSGYYYVRQTSGFLVIIIQPCKQYRGRVELASVGGKSICSGRSEPGFSQGPGGEWSQSTRRCWSGDCGACGRCGRRCACLTLVQLEKGRSLAFSYPLQPLSLSSLLSVPALHSDSLSSRFGTERLSSAN